MPISETLIDQLLEGHSSSEELLGKNGLFKQLAKRLAERVLEAEIEHHLGYEKHDTKGKNTGNSRNGKTTKSVRSVHGNMDIDIPRDRNSTFEPKLVKKHDKQLNGFDERVISLYAKGMTTRDIQAHFMDAYNVDISTSFISQVTNTVMEEVRAWQTRPLDVLYPIVFLDALVVRSRASGSVRNKHVYLDSVVTRNIVCNAVPFQQ